MAHKKKANREKKPRGRPTDYDPVLGKEICEKMSGKDGIPKSLRTVVEEYQGSPALGTVMRWLAENDDFQEHYRRACELRAHLFVDESTDISDENPRMKRIVSRPGVEGTTEVLESTDHGGVQRNKLRIEARQWYASVCAPKKYGPKVNVGVEGSLAVVISSLKEIKE